MVLKTLESPLDCKEIQPVCPEGNQSWIFIGWTDVEAEVPILCPPDAKDSLIGKDPDAGKRLKWKRTTEDEMVGWHHRLEWHEFEQAPGVSDGQGGLACCSPWGCKELDTIEWTDLNIIVKTTKLNFFYMCPLPKYLSGQSNTSVTLWRNPLPSPTSSALCHILMRCWQYCDGFHSAPAFKDCSLPGRIKWVFWTQMGKERLA